MKKPQPGATHDFPHGKLYEDDEGGLNVAIGHHTAPDGTCMVRFDFGPKPVKWLSLPRENAIAFAIAIVKHSGFIGSIIVGEGEMTIEGEEAETSSGTHKSG